MIIDLHLIFASAPPHVDPPEVEAIQSGIITLRLSRASERNGPLSHYHVVVVPLKSMAHAMMPADFTMDEVIVLGR